ncbi:small GTP-binding protein [Thermodesulfobacterium geofontis OPF15]|jgi:elongation factor G|uniref:Elongation factor G n=1 Tax=Thermodesulfobacterium geofontis (strain OPF15) TaxID=795359 RepID=F8C331_THEGP|nr:elongation factor G [Thermodesulfobacterium geofontis]AEH23522.1 small GTP-binding protein [Thermodesulfobacterium geofontis OPF15]
MEPKVLAILGQTESGKATFCENLCKLCGETIKTPKKEPFYYLKIYGLKYKNNPFYLLNTPGDENFMGEIKWALKVADAGILLVDTTSVLKYHNLRVFEFAKEEGVPLFVFLNKIDDLEKSNIEETLSNLNNTLEISHIPITYAFKQSNSFSLIDLIEEKVFIEEGLKIKYQELPENLKDKIIEMRDKLMESAAESSDTLIEKYLEEGKLEKEEILNGLKETVKKGNVNFVFTGSAKTGAGLVVFLEYMLHLPPSYKLKLEKENITPSNAIGFIFKNYIDPYAGKLSYGRIFVGNFTSDGVVYTSEGKEEKYTQIFIPKGDYLEQVKEVNEGEIIVFSKVESLTTGSTFSNAPISVSFSVPEMPFPMITMALHPETRADEDKISGAISKVKEEDPSIVFKRNEETRELLISGVGLPHIEKTVEKLKEKYGVKVKLTTPKIPYRETIKKPVQSVIYRHKKQTGGRGQFAEVHFHIFPLERGKGFEFVETLTGMNVPRNYVPAVEKGVREAMEKGPLAGYPVVDVKVQFYDGKSHEVDSSDLAFKIAAFHCFKKGIEQANPVLLEPYLELEIIVPDETVGDVVGDLNARRGRVLSLEKEGKRTKIKALAPMAELQGYVITLQGITAGRGYFIAKFSHYEEAPPFIAEKVIAESKEAQEKETK